MIIMKLEQVEDRSGRLVDGVVAEHPTYDLRLWYPLGADPQWAVERLARRHRHLVRTVPAWHLRPMMRKH